MDKLEKLREPLTIDRLDFRIQSVTENGYATILVYKDARVDMERLDNVIGALNWKREHTRDNQNCIVSIWDEEKKQWVSKEDTGTESNTEKEKGLASDSFKRACFNWGIGRELYAYPRINLNLFPEEFVSSNGKAKVTWKLKIKEWVWKSEFNDGVIISLVAIDNNKKERFNWSLSGGYKFISNKLEPQNEPSQPTSPPPPDNRAWLNVNTEQFNGAVEYIKQGNSIDSIKKKYKISKETESEIYNKVKS